MGFTGPAADRDAIRDLYASYADASACADVDAFLSCFTQDAEWNTHVFQRRGKADLQEQWDQLWLGFEKVAFLTQIGAIVVDGERASCRCVASETIRLKNGGVFKLVGQYRDQLVRQDGAWLFARRDYEPVWEEAPA